MPRDAKLFKPVQPLAHPAAYRRPRATGKLHIWLPTERLPQFRIPKMGFWNPLSAISKLHTFTLSITLSITTITLDRRVVIFLRNKGLPRRRRRFLPIR